MINIRWFTDDQMTIVQMSLALKQLASELSAERYAHLQTVRDWCLHAHNYVKHPTKLLAHDQISGLGILAARRLRESRE